VSVLCAAFRLARALLRQAAARYSVNRRVYTLEATARPFSWTGDPSWRGNVPWKTGCCQKQRSESEPNVVLDATGPSPDGREMAWSPQ